MDLSPEVITALSMFAAVIAAQLLKGAVRAISSFVKGTPTSIDDKIWAAVRGAVRVEKAIERNADLR